MMRQTTGAAKAVVVVVVLLAMTLTVLWLNSENETRQSGGSLSATATLPRTASLSVSAPASSPPAPVKTPTQAELARLGSPLADEMLRSDRPAQEDLKIVCQLISQYLTALQNQPGPPIGDNADLVRALTGKNPLRLPVIPSGHAALSVDGRLLDRWGTPYHIHAVSAGRFEIRSAGADRRLFTADDLTAQ